MQSVHPQFSFGGSSHPCHKAHLWPSMLSVEEKRQPAFICVHLRLWLPKACICGSLHFRDSLPIHLRTLHHVLRSKSPHPMRPLLRKAGAGDRPGASDSFEYPELLLADPLAYCERLGTGLIGWSFAGSTSAPCTRSSFPDRIRMGRDIHTSARSRGKCPEVSPCQRRPSWRSGAWWYP